MLLLTDVPTSRKSVASLIHSLTRLSYCLLNYVVASDKYEVCELVECQPNVL
jgi:hypothetical protein